MVCNGDRHGVITTGQCHLDGLGFAVVDGVGQKVTQDALDSACIANECDGLFRHCEFDGDSKFFSQVLSLLPGGAEHVAGVDAFFG